MLPLLLLLLLLAVVLLPCPRMLVPLGINLLLARLHVCVMRLLPPPELLSILPCVIFRLLLERLRPMLPAHLRLHVFVLWLVASAGVLSIPLSIIIARLLHRLLHWHRQLVLTLRVRLLPNVTVGVQRRVG